MTRGQMVSDIQQWLGLQQMDAFDETPLIQNAIYRGTIDLLKRTRCVARCVTLHYQANQQTYTLDHSIMALVEVADDTVDRARRDQTGIPQSGYIGTTVWPQGAVVSQPFTFTLIRSDIFRINPTPTADGTFQVWAVLVPQQMQLDTDSPGLEAYGAIPEEYQDAIELYALWKMSDYADDQSGGIGERYRIQYEGQDGRGGRIMQIRGWVNKRGTARAAPRRVSIQRSNLRDTWVA